MSHLKALHYTCMDPDQGLMACLPKYKGFMVVLIPVVLVCLITFPVGGALYVFVV